MSFFPILFWPQWNRTDNYNEYWQLPQNSKKNTIYPEVTAYMSCDIWNIDIIWREMAVLTVMSLCSAKMKTADHRVTAPLIPLSGRWRPGFTAHPALTRKQKWSKYEAKGPVLPHSSLRRIVGGRDSGAPNEDIVQNHLTQHCWT